MTAVADHATKDWVRNPSDERAVAAGCRFDEERGRFVQTWIQTYCRLYEGEWAGEPLVLRDWQEECTLRLFGWVRWSARWNRWVRRFRQASIWIAKKNKKALCLETEVPTPSGFRRFGDLAVGDQVYDEDGRPCRVTRVTETWMSEACYEVEFSDGAKVVADRGHLWQVESFKAGYRPRVLTTAELAESVDVVNARGEAWAKNHRIPVAGPVQSAEAELPIPPYTLGVWLGDGDSDSPRVTTADAEILVGVAAEGVRVGPATGKRGLARRYKLGDNLKGGRQADTLRARLRAAGVLFDKHIPDDYLFASERQRLALLTGLMDTDGAVSKAGQCVYVSTNPRLASDVRTLVASLGWKPTLRVSLARCQTGATSTAYRVQFWAGPDRPCFTVPRKLSRLRPPTKGKTRAMTRHIVAVRPVPPVPVRCISVDSPSQLFLVTRSFLSTHNSPTLAAWGLYLLCGDGEAGQKVFLAAKDGQQAREIAGKHAVEMLLQSDALMAECALNRNTLQITHVPSRSIMLPLSSSNQRTQQSKEGLNGSVLIDEVHVVDRDFVRRINRAGISRSEPLQIEVSTAGNDPTSYGFERFQYSREVVEGQREDQDLFVAIYAAPQDLTQEDLDQDPERYGRLANPAWGHTVDPEEFRKDYTTSKRSLPALLDFMMYRLNIWQRSSNPWLRAADWEQCQSAYTAEDLAGRTCVLALDMSRTRDMTAGVFAFPSDEDEEAFDLLPYFFLPSARVEELDSVCPVKTWAAEGHLIVTPGEVLDYGHVIRHLHDRAREFDLREIVYDPKYAEEVTQALADGLIAPDGTVLVEGLGVERVAFAQNDANFAAPTQDFERAVVSHKLRHNGHPILAWQAGHVQVLVKPLSRVKRAVKPKEGEFRTVDGILAGIMGLARAKLLRGGGGGVEFW